MAQAVSRQTYRENVRATGNATLRSGPGSARLSSRDLGDHRAATFTFEKDCADGGSVAWSGLAQQNEARYSTAIKGTLTYRECPSTVVGDSSRCRLVLETTISATGMGIVGGGSIGATTAGRVCGHEVERSFSVERTAS